ncbi:MAG: amino acid transporter [Caulobacter sp.]|nr:amino acid transporter [Caulobacter sp.]
MTDIPAGKLTQHSPKDRAFFGHPRGLAFIALTEGGVTFSYYGMRAILVLYMANQLLTPGHVEHIWGFQAFKNAVDHIYGPTALGKPLASAIGGLFSTVVFATPFLFGLLADRVLSRKGTIMWGAAILTLGHFLMAFESTFLIALACLFTGMGCIGNLKAQVGSLYEAGDNRRADAFQLFVLAVQVSVIFSPLICGSLAKSIGYEWGFGAAGVGMALGFAIYLMAGRWLPPDPVVKTADGKNARPPLTSKDWRTISVLVLLLPVLALTAVANEEIGNAYLLWGQDNFQLMFFGKEMPVSWLVSLDAIVSTVTLILSVMFWRWYDSRFRALSEITKVAIGATITAFGPLVLVAASMHAAGGHKVGLGYGLAFHIINDFGFANVYAIGLALFSRAAPPALAATIVSAFTLHLSITNFLVGKLGTYLTVMPGPLFWGMHAAIVGVGAVLLFIFAFFFRKTLAPDEPTAPLDQPILSPDAAAA